MSKLSALEIENKKLRIKLIKADDLASNLQKSLNKIIDQNAEWHCEFSRLREENDLQRASIQNLSCQVAAYQIVLNDTYSMIAGRVIQLRDAGETKAMEQWNDMAKRMLKILESTDPGAEIRERLLEAETHNEIINHRMEELRKAWRDQHPDVHCWPDLGKEFDWMMERMAKLEAVAKAAKEMYEWNWDVTASLGQTLINLEGGQ